MRFTHRLIFLSALTGAIVIAGSTPGAQDSRAAQGQLRAARQLEEVAGDLPAAIAAYRKLATNSDRAIAAEALLRLAGCQEQLGLAEAKKSYQELLAKFGDQSAVATEARRRLGELDRPRTSSGSDEPRNVWSIPENVRIVGPVTADGRYVPFATDGGGDLAIHDLRDGTERVIPPTPADQQARKGGAYSVAESVISRDGRQVASRMGVSRVGGGLVFTQLTISQINDRPNDRTKRILIDGADVVPYDWFPDGRAIAVRKKLTATTYQIGIVTLADSAFRILKTMEWGSTTKFGGRLSPDGSRLAIEVPTNVLGSRDILVLPVDGGSEIRAVEWSGDDILLGWSPDGSSILFSSARGSGTLDVWRQRLDARSLASGRPELVRRNGPARPLGVSLTGALFSQDDGEPGEGRCWTTPTCEVKEAVFDFDNGVFLSPPRDVSQAFVRSNESPRWSPDGTRLAYYAHRGGRDGVIVVKDLRTGDSRDIPVNFFFNAGNPHRWDWAPDGESFIAQGQDADRKSDGGALHRIDLKTGKVSLILPDMSSMHFSYLSWSPDGRTLFYHRPSNEPLPPGQSSAPTVLVSRDTTTGSEQELAGGRVPRYGTKYYDARRDSRGGMIVEVDTASKSERELLRVYGSSTVVYSYSLTNDGRTIMASTTDVATNEGMIVALSVADGAVRTVFRDARGHSPFVQLLSRDGRSAIVSTTSQAGTPVFWWVPFDGRAPKPLDEMAGVNLVTLGARHQTIELHPDGRRLAFNSAYPQALPNRLMVVENVVSPAQR